MCLLKLSTGVGYVVQWQSTCLTRVKSWIQSPAPQKENQSCKHNLYNL